MRDRQGHEKMGGDVGMFRLIMGHASWLRYRSPMASMGAAVSTVRSMITPWSAGRRTHMHLRRVEETQVPRGYEQCHKTPHGVEAALDQVWHSPAISRLIFARPHPLEKGPRDRAA
jgi:hypothetical protein